MRLAVSVILGLGVLVGCGEEAADSSPSGGLVSSSFEAPAWAEGLWAGRLAFEHDTTSHRLRLNLATGAFSYPALGCRGRVVADTTTPRMLRGRLVAEAGSWACGELAGGIAEVHRSTRFDRLHLQYWPEGAPRLFLAQLRPVEQTPLLRFEPSN